MARISSSLSALRFSGRLRTTWRTGRGLRSARGSWRHHDGFGLASRPFMLRPLPHRGDVVAAGAVALAALVALLQVRFDDTWATGVHFVYSRRRAGLRRHAGAARAARGRGAARLPARCWPSTFALAVPTLARLSLLLGSDGLDSSGTLAWAGAALAALGFGLAAARGSALCVLLGAVEPRPRRPGLRRPGLLARRASRPSAGCCSRSSPASRSPPSPRATASPSAPSPSPTPAGLTALALALTLAWTRSSAPRRSSAPALAPAGSSSSTRAASGCARSRPSTARPGPGWIGVAVLLATTVAAAGGKATLVGWPLVLAVGAGGLLGHRPAPEPAAAARPLARRGPRLRDQERAVSDLHEALDRALARRPRAPPRQGARAGQAARARARRAAARRRLVRRGGAAGQLGGRGPGRRRRRHRPGAHRRAAGRGDGQRPDGEGRLVGPEDGREDHPHPGARAEPAGADGLPRRLGRARASPTRCRCSPAAAAPGRSSTPRSSSRASCRRCACSSARPPPAAPTSPPSATS